MSRRLRTMVEAAMRAVPAVATIGTAVWATAGLRAPRPRRGGVGPDRFSAARAEVHLRAIAGEARPSGSDAAAATCDYLVNQLTALGFEVDVHTSVGVSTSTSTPYGPRYLGAGRVRNVVARLPGTVPGSAVAVMSHYDSVAQGPGATDAGVPVAAILEAARGLRERGPLRNDLLIVLTDGEECGLLGARAFFAEHPWSATVRAVVNFEARGTTGPVLMFETGPGNGPIIRELAEADVPVFASSLFYEVYRRLPNATDFSVSKEIGVPGMNFANIGGFVHYHGPFDDLDHADRASLQHHGELVLALAERLGNRDLAKLNGRDQTFFTLGSGRLVRYGMWTARVAAFSALGAWSWAARRKAGGVLLRALARDALPTLGRLISGAAVTTGLVWGLGRRSPEFRRSGDFYDADRVYAALAGVVTSSALLSRRSGAERSMGAQSVLAAACTALTATLPGGSYLATWPLLGGALGSLASGSSSRTIATTATTVSALPAGLILAPLARLFYQGLTPRLSATSTVTWQLVGELSAPAFDRLHPALRRVVAGGLFALSAGTLLRSFLGRDDDRRPIPETLSYLHDADRGRAYWISSDAEPTAWTSRALGCHYDRGRLESFFPGWTREFLSTPAPVLPLSAPVVEILADQPRPGGRRVTLRVCSSRGARQLSLSVPNGDVRRWAVDGRGMDRDAAGVGEPGRPWELWLHAADEDGFLVELDLPAEPMELRVLDRSDGIPEDLAEKLLATGPEPVSRTVAPALDVESWGNATYTSRWVRL